jgi:transcriptional regulator with XRE-family HTH domain
MSELIWPEMVAATVRQLRRERGWTPAELAQQAGIRPSTVERIERSDFVRMRRGDRLEKIATAFGVPVQKLAPLTLVTRLHPAGQRSAARGPGRETDSARTALH